MGHLVIYKITNLVNGKLYVGRTSRTPPEKRWKEHLRTARTEPKYRFHLAIRKYGAENFRFEILAEYDDVDEWTQAEIDYTLQYRSHEREYGYNITIGSTGGGVPQLDAKTVDELRSKYATGRYTYRQLADKSGLSLALVKCAVRGRDAYARIGKQLPRDRRTKRVRRPAHAHKELRMLSPRDVARLRREYQHGSPTPEIARRHRLSKTLVKRAVFGRDGYANMKCSVPPAEFVSYALRADDIEEIRRRYATGWYSYKDLAQDFGIGINVARPRLAADVRIRAIM